MGVGEAAEKVESGDDGGCELAERLEGGDSWPGRLVEGMAEGWVFFEANAGWNEILTVNRALSFKKKKI